MLAPVRLYPELRSLNLVAESAFAISYLALDSTSAHVMHPCAIACCTVLLELLAHQSGCTYSGTVLDYNLFIPTLTRNLSAPVPFEIQWHHCILRSFLLVFIHGVLQRGMCLYGKGGLQMDHNVPNGLVRSD